MFKSTLARRRSIISPVKHVRYCIPDRTDARQLASASRLQRSGPQWRSISDPAFLSQLTVLHDGGRERPVITRSQAHLRSKFVSRKTGLLQRTEGLGERCLAIKNEVNYRVFDYHCHYLKYTGIVKLPGLSKRFDYFPDAISQERDGPVKVIEIKRSDRDLSDPFYREKLAEFREACRQWGWEFEILTEDDILEPGTPLFQQMMSVFGRASLALEPEEEAISAKLLARGAAFTWAEFSNAVAPDDQLQGDMVIEHLIGTNRLATPLNAKFSPQSILEPVLPFTGKAGFRL